MKNNRIIAGVMATMLVIGAGTVVINKKFNFTDSAIASTTSQHNPFRYDVNDNGTIAIIDFDESVTDIEIPSEIDGKIVTTIEDYAFDHCESLKTVTIPESIISIGFCAFGYCSALTSITIPDSVTSIESYAFKNCTGLQSLTLSNNISKISQNAFSNCIGLKSVTIPDSVTIIGSDSFSNCSGLTSITIPNNVTTIGDGAFSGCSGLTSITIPNNVTTIKSNAFSSCSALTSITIPKSVTSIESSAFSKCKQLSEITIMNPNCNINDSAYTISNDSDNYTGIIYGYEDSTAQEYADKYDRKFRTISSGNNDVNEGDINHDGFIDAVDASIISSYYAYLSTNQDSYTMTIAEFQKTSQIDK